MTGAAKSTRLGPAFPELGWVPSPRYWLRRQRVLSWARRIPPGRLLEIGCGIGALMLDFKLLGFDCTGVEISAEARAKAHQALQGAGIPVLAEPAEDWEGTFDVVCAFEVLEHIEDDLATLTQWRNFLRPGGHLLLSVPAHPALWNQLDEWAGHFRRYSRGQLMTKVRRAGFDPVTIRSYGFPVAVLAEIVAFAWLSRNLATGRAVVHEDKLKNSARSGIERDFAVRLFPLMSSLIGTGALHLSDLLQIAAGRSPLGNGYLLMARTA